MTPEERATKLVATSLDDWCGDNGDQKPHGLYLGQMILEIAAEIREAIEAERERLAAMFDTSADSGTNKEVCTIYRVVAQTIRSSRVG
jgi:hypothetical protein